MKLSLDNALIAEEFFENTHLLGIVAPIKAFQFVWHINKKMGCSFRLNHELEIQLRKKNRDYFFAVYEYNVPGMVLTHYLYHNQHEGEYLLPEFKNLDFLWLTKGDELSSIEVSELQKTIRMLPSVLLVNEMSNEKIKHKEHLIF